MELNPSPDFQGIINEENNQQDTNCRKLSLLASISSWLLLIISGWMFFIVPNFKYLEIVYTYYYRTYSYKQKIFWCYQIIKKNKKTSTIPLSIYYINFYMIAIIILLFVTASFIIYMHSIFIKKDINVLNGILGKYSQFHFIPLGCISALFIIGETLEEKDTDNPFKGIHYCFSLIFKFLALTSLIFVTYQTKIDSPSYVAWTIKHGAYSSLIALLMHNLCYIISNYGLYLKVEKKSTDNIKDWMKGTSIVFAIVIGLGNMILSLVLKEMFISVTNILIYIGMIIHFFKIEKKTRKDIFSNAPGIIEPFIIFFSILIAAFLFIRSRGPSILSNAI
jgi:hypothetical protein